MKQSPKIKQAQENMRPGVITINGFLGKDVRDLAEILDNDDNTVRKLGLSHQIIADKMREMRNKGEAGLDEFIKVAPHFEVKVATVRGGIACPFGDKGLIPKSNITVKNLKSGEEIIYTDLNIHFIEKHGFYEGKGAQFRIVPEKIIRILEIENAC